MATRPAVPKIPVREDDVQEVIVNGLMLNGYEVLITSRRVKGEVCNRCRKWFRIKNVVCPYCANHQNVQPKGDGVSKGLPDLMVTRKTWPKWLFLGIEVKGPETRVSPEQQDLANRNRIIICRSYEEALAAAREVDQLFAPGGGA